MAHPHVVTEVPRIGTVGVRLGGRDAHAAARRDADRGIGEARDQRLQGPPLDVHGSIGMHNDLSPKQRQRRVFRRRLPAAARQAQEMNPAARVFAYDRLGAIGRGVGHHEDAPPVRGIVEL